MAALRWGCHKAMCTNATTARGFSQFGEDKMMFQSFFCDTCPGRTYVEIGALDGVKYSNTLFLERNFNWHGVLVEGHPENAAKLFHMRGKSGKNIIFNEAICSHANIIPFSGPSGLGTAGVMYDMDESYLRSWGHRFRNTRNYTVPCRPLTALLKLAGIRKIDVFSLDVEGAEYKVLQTMDWSIDVHVWLVEMSQIDRSERNEAIRWLLARNNYIEARIDVPGPNRIFVHRDLNGTLLQRMRYCATCKQQL